MIWQEISGGWVLLPRNPIGIVHFLGGAFVATAPQITYRWLLEELGKAGFAVVATPFLNTLDHTAIARDVLNRFETIHHRLLVTNALEKRYLPIYGIGHSMGCKLHLLIGSLFSVDRAGNILISYNNYPVRQAIPFAAQFNLTPVFNVEFTPSPEETNELIAEAYQIRRNLLIKFTNDTIDQTIILNPVLETKFPRMVAMQTLPGTHTTPLAQDVNWQAGNEFTPLDAIAQFVKQSFSRDLYRLKQEVLRWLNPVVLS
ncbi:DUF1350 family protein [Oscillatoria salina]|uniref:DUF1350 family protein n=1 Tax=Oscillatoria salina TaxID=331517 RepID=UPI001CCF967F|nr:DUF1350 family protein [Oscillatoria salina]MBZ8182864.1 DUF1350 domain-containing protein [Oscillatoria salina IIICB1]